MPILYDIIALIKVKEARTILILSQIVGIMAVITYVLSYQLKKRKNITAVNATSSILYVLQYILLGAFEGAVLDVLSALATVVAHNKDKKILARHIKWVFAIIYLTMVASGLILYKNLFSLCPIVGAVLQTGAFWISDERKIRIVSFISGPFWLAYNIASCAYGSALGNIMCMISIGIAIYRYDIIKKSEED